MPEQIERYLLVLEALQVAPNYKTVEDIRSFLQSKGHEVTPRTVQRILKDYRDRFDLECREKPNASGRPPLEWAYSRKRGPPSFQQMDPPTALTFQLAAELLHPVLPGPFLEQMEQDFRRARQVLGQIGPGVRRLPQKLRILPRGQGRMASTVEPKILNDVFNAVLTEKRIEVTYVSQARDDVVMATHELSPLGLVFRFDSFYLVHVGEPKNPRQDRNLVMEWPLHRFNSVKLLDTAIYTPPDFDLDEHLRQPGFMRNTFLDKVARLGPTIKLKLLFNNRTARYVRERPFSEGQTAKFQEDGRVLVTATVRNNREMLSELLNFMDDVEVLEPKALRDYFRQLAKNLHHRYTPGS